MKKITFLMALAFLWSFTSFAQYIDEDFESGTFPPAGWTDVAGAAHVVQTDPLEPLNDWGSSAARSNSPSNSAFFDDFDIQNDKWLISPAFDLSGAVNPELLYFDNVNFAGFAGVQDVLWSDDYTGSGDPALATWNLLNDVIGTEDTWVQNGPFPILSTGTQVYIAFHYEGDFTAEWYIDDVLVRDALTCTPPAVSSAAIIEDCPNSEFSLELIVSDLGDSATVTVTNDGGEPDVDVTSVPTTVTLGPFPAGTPVNVSLLHETNSDCDLDFAPAVDACPPPAPANDDFANAQTITCSTTALTGSTASATLDEDEAPDGFTADMDAPNVWFSYDSSVEGAADVTVSLCGSTYDTSLLVYTGTSGNLTIVGGNDDNEACGAFSIQSQATFTANGTDTYWIAVEGYNPTSVGDFTMTVTCEASCTPAQTNQDCASATSLLVDGSTSTEDNTCATVNAETNSCELFQTIADLWYTFEAPASGEVNIVTALGTATAAHLAVYEGTCGALVELDCSTAVTSGASLTGLTGGATYYVQLWNNGSEEGTIDITLSDASLSTSSFENEKAFTYFPNPVKNELSLKSQNTIQNVSVFNMLGQEVLRATPNTLESNIDMNGLSQGAYFVQVTINNVTETVRILKQ
ncbi:T9SS type A sorting domain-containing protein [Psychroserpens mesophilus]|uniref:T9SS type A sorting domain-containing protein n=1 Tax=Psychroserpens mesophilus TaxID=325473 RepID=UPI003D661CCD